MDEETKKLLDAAKFEIIRLRRQNEKMSDKLEMIELFKLVFHTKPLYPSQGFGEDIVWKIEQKLEVSEIPSENA